MYKCPNNSEHNLVKSKHTPTSYVCNQCEGFSCWDISELARENYLIIPYEKICRMNEKLIELIDVQLGPIPFSFRIDYSDNKNKLILKAYSIVDGGSITKSKVHAPTRIALKEILNTIGKEFSSYVLWDDGDK